jgi:hypothetical protein
MKLSPIFKTGLAAILFLSLSHSLSAGWILTGKFIDQDGKTIMQRMYIQDFNVKFEQYNIIYTLNLKTNSIILVDPVNLVYYKGTIDAYIEGEKRMKTNQLQSLLKEIPAAEQETWKSICNQQINCIGMPIPLLRDSISVERMNDTLKVFGKPTAKFLVSIDKRRAEETWISPSLDISTQFDWQKYLYLLSVLEPGTASFTYMISPPFQELLSKGFPVRRIMVVNGYRNEIQVNRLEEKKIPDYEFYTPALCKELSIEQWLGRNKAQETMEDDYE